MTDLILTCPNCGSAEIDDSPHPVPSYICTECGCYWEPHPTDPDYINFLSLPDESAS